MSYRRLDPNFIELTLETQAGKCCQMVIIRYVTIIIIRNLRQGVRAWGFWADASQPTYTSQLQHGHHTTRRSCKSLAYCVCDWFGNIFVKFRPSWYIQDEDAF